MNLYQLVWDWSQPYSLRANQIDQKILEMERINFQQHNGALLKGLRPLTFDIYYPFTQDLEGMKNWSKQWKQLKLARKVMRVVREWYKHWEIDLKKKVSYKLFHAFFVDKINMAKNYMCHLGINYYKYPEVSLKTLVLWGYKLRDLGIISVKLYNDFMEYLEGLSND